MASHFRNLYFWKTNQSTFKENSIILITGAGSGIGQSISQIYAQRKCSLVLADINVDGLKQTEILCKKVQPNIKILLIQVDVTDQSSVQSTNQSINQSRYQSDEDEFDETEDEESINQSISQSSTQSNNQSVNQSNNQSMRGIKPTIEYLK